jgi:hypothetical protein
MVNCERFQELDGQRYLILEFYDQNQTKAKVVWSKMEFFLLQMAGPLRLPAL